MNDTEFEGTDTLILEIQTLCRYKPCSVVATAAFYVIAEALGFQGEYSLEDVIEALQRAFKHHDKTH
jgi:hypothetical protein